MSKFTVGCEFLTCRKMAEKFGVAESLIRSLAKQGRIKAYKVSERCTLFSVLEFKEDILGIKDN